MITALVRKEASRIAAAVGAWPSCVQLFLLACATGTWWRQVNILGQPRSFPFTIRSTAVLVDDLCRRSVCDSGRLVADAYGTDAWDVSLFASSPSAENEHFWREAGGGCGGKPGGDRAAAFGLCLVGRDARYASQPVLLVDDQSFHGRCA